MKMTLALLLLFFSGQPAIAQQLIKVHFLYGSVPAKGHGHIEKKRFGGKKGGHVTIQFADSIIGFQPAGNCHLIAAKKKNGYFKVEKEAQWVRDTIGNKYTSIIIPVTDSQYTAVSAMMRSFLQETPYDYAVFGMRCAAATYDILEDIKLFPPKTRMAKWSGNFYPQVFRRKMLKLAKENNYTIIRHAGVKTRTWEKE